MTNINSQIIDCGAYFIGHYNTLFIKVYGDTWGIEIPNNRIREFLDIFPEEDFEDGKFLHKAITGKYVRLFKDETGKFVAISNILKDKIYYINEVKCDG